MNTTRYQMNDEGATLLLALIFMTVFALILGGLLPAVTSGLVNSTVVRSYDAKLYVADAGIDFGIQQLRWDPSFCPNPAAGTESLTMPSTDPRVGVAATVSCSANFGTTNILGGYAVVTTGAVPSITTQNGGNKLIDGPVWASGLPTNPTPKLEIKGNVQQGTTACSQITGVVIDPPFTCSASSAAPSFGITIPSAATLASHLTSAGSPNGNGKISPALTLGSCRVFKPGIYTAPMDFGNQDNYLASGVYYLNNVTLDIGSYNVIGGAVSPGDDYLNNINETACSNDAAAGDSNNGQGVLFILDGTSHIIDSTGLLELFARANGAAWEGLDGLTVATESTWSNANNAIEIDSGNTNGKELIIHGAVYTPTGTVYLGATSAPSADVLGGVVASKLILDHAANVSNGTLISTHTGIGFRRVLLTATVPGSNGGRDVVATAVVDVQNDAAAGSSAGNTVTVESRRNGGLSATS